MTTIAKIKNPPTGEHASNGWATNQAKPSEYYPAVYEVRATPKGGTTSHRIKPAWKKYLRDINVRMGTLKGYE